MVVETRADERPVVLSVEAISKAFGGIQAVSRCSLGVVEGSVTGLIGPNGSGKTTLFNILTGMERPDAGHARFRDRRITGLAPHEIVRLGLARTFQITRVFPKLTVLENLRLGTLHRARADRRDARIDELLGLVDLWAHRDEYADALSYGQQKLVEFCRVLLGEPQLILLDEPFAGVNRVMATKLITLIHKLKAGGGTVFLIDHEMKLVMELCEHVYVMDFGQVIAEGSPDVVRRDPRVLEAYFGR
jgi:ABC-type branched-subunit amino acid transport system ATPase component